MDLGPTEEILSVTVDAPVALLTEIVKHISNEHAHLYEAGVELVGAILDGMTDLDDEDRGEFLAPLVEQLSTALDHTHFGDFDEEEESDEEGESDE